MMPSPMNPTATVCLLGSHTLFPAQPPWLTRKSAFRQSRAWDCTACGRIPPVRFARIWLALRCPSRAYTADTGERDRAHRVALSVAVGHHSAHMARRQLNGQVNEEECRSLRGSGAWPWRQLRPEEMQVPSGTSALRASGLLRHCSSASLYLCTARIVRQRVCGCAGWFFLPSHPPLCQASGHRCGSSTPQTNVPLPPHDVWGRAGRDGGARQDQLVLSYAGQAGREGAVSR
jgi:hypothetical protein